MMQPSRNQISAIKAEFQHGDRVALVWMDDPQAPDIGTLGTVERVDDIGTIHVAWDSGSHLGVAFGEDRCRKLPICPVCGEAYLGYPALSRTDNKTDICPRCGVAEAIAAYLNS